MLGHNLGSVTIFGWPQSLVGRSLWLAAIFTKMRDVERFVYLKEGSGRTQVCLQCKPVWYPSERQGDISGNFPLIQPCIWYVDQLYCFFSLAFPSTTTANVHSLDSIGLRASFRSEKPAILLDDNAHHFFAVDSNLLYDHSLVLMTN